MTHVYQSMEHLRQRKMGMTYILVLCMSLVLGPLAAVQAQGDPVAFLKAQDKEVRGLLKVSDGKGDTARNAKLDKALSDLLDFEELAKRSLAKHWDGLDDAKRRAFTDLLRELVERSYRQNLRSTLDFEVEYAAATRAKDGWLVGTVARSRKNRRAPEVTIDYAMAQRGNAWKVFDVVTDGVSLVQNYQRQFDRIITKQGFDALLDKMRKKVGQREDAL